MKDLRLGAYMRVSTQQWEDVTSFDTQEEQIRKFGQDGGAILIEEYFEREIGSAKDLDRPKLNRMLRGVDEGAIDGFIVFDFDRLWRDHVTCWLIMNEIKEAGGRIYSVMDGHRGNGNDFIIRIIHETRRRSLLMVLQWLTEGVSCDQIAKRLNEQLTPSKRVENGA